MFIAQLAALQQGLGAIVVVQALRDACADAGGALPDAPSLQRLGAMCLLNLLLLAALLGWSWRGEAQAEGQPAPVAPAPTPAPPAPAPGVCRRSVRGLYCQVAIPEKSSARASVWPERYSIAM